MKSCCHLFPSLIPWWISLFFFSKMSIWIVNLGNKDFFIILWHLIHHTINRLIEKTINRNITDKWSTPQSQSLVTHYEIYWLTTKEALNLINCQWEWDNGMSQQVNNFGSETQRLCRSTQQGHMGNSAYNWANVAQNTTKACQRLDTPTVCMLLMVVLITHNLLG